MGLWENELADKQNTQHKQQIISPKFSKTLKNTKNDASLQIIKSIQISNLCLQFSALHLTLKKHSSKLEFSVLFHSSRFTRAQKKVRIVFFWPGFIVFCSFLLTSLRATQKKKTGNKTEWVRLRHIQCKM